MPTIHEFVQELDQEAPATRRLLERVPDDRLDWRPHAKSMALGALAAHLASLPRAIVDLARQATFDASQTRPRPAATNSAELVRTFDENVAYAKEQLSAMSDADLALPWKMVMGDRVVLEITRGAVLRSILFNHSYHHRGQLTVYLRENDVPLPPVYGPSADEMPFGL